MSGSAPGAADSQVATISPPPPTGMSQVPTVVEQPSASGGMAWPTVPGYEILGELGHGGMGVVYKARQEGADRLVALKFIRGGLDNDDLRQRFRHEARALARAEHPHIVRIYEVGEAGGAPFFSMEYVAGGSLAQRLRGGTLPFAEAARLTEAVARAIEAAHRAGVLHRDLKPANILLTGEPGAPLDQCEPRVTDFGLARHLETNDGHTPSGVMLGTPGFMAPEQATGAGEMVGPATDVYGLGALLYALLTGVPPFRAETALATALLVVSAPLQAPGRLRSGLPRDLEAICLKCLARVPTDRYPSAAALADDLDRFRRGLPVRRPRTHRWWGLAAFAALLGAALLFQLLDPRSAAPTAPAAAPPQPVDPLQTLEAELDAGRPVILIGAQGPPRYQRVLRGAPQTYEAANKDDAFALQSFSESYLELLPDPRRNAYRFRADIRHHSRERFTDNCVGLFLGYRHKEFPDHSDLSVLVRFTFQECESPGMDIVPARQRHSDFLLGTVALSRRIGRPPGQVPVHWDHSPFEPVLDDPPYRRLIVDIRPDGIRAAWHELDDPRTDWFGFPWMSVLRPLPAAEMPARVDAKLKRSIQLAGHLPGVDLDWPAWQPRLPLGLVLSRGGASFRNVVVEPLPIVP